MCDTMVALGNSTKDGSVIFAKNSDRQPNEPQLLMHLPGERHLPNEKVTCTYIDVDQAEETYDVFLLKPSWMWGGEMGVNEHGLTIGNEAVFTKEKVNKTGLLGMDLVRLALERCKNSEEAVHCITSLLETYGQGGNCGYEKPFTYHNSFLIADRSSAWVLETAGEYWVAKKVKDVRSISNRLTIGTHYDLSHPEVVRHAIEKGWHKAGETFHFANVYNDFLFTKLSGSADRCACSQTILNNQKGGITEETMKSILRSHHEELTDSLFKKSSVKSICMHAGFIYGDQTTGSFVISLNNETGDLGWMTGSSAPCISTFKPLHFSNEPTAFFKNEDQQEALHFWLEREVIHRLLMKSSKDIVEQYNEDRIILENEMRALTTHDANSDQIAWDMEQKLINRYLSKLTTNGKISGNIYYRRYWKKQNKQLQANHPDFFSRKAFRLDG